MTELTGRCVGRLLLGMWGLLGGLGHHAGAQAPEDQRLNVLLITSDDLGLQLGCYGDPLARTPRLDALAAESTRFEVAYVAQASCSPSRSAMFTGLYPHTNGQYALTNSGYALHPELHDRTLPNLLKPAGYRTAIIGKLHVSPEDSFAFDERVKVNTREIAQVAERAGQIFSQSDQPFFLMTNFSDPHWDRNAGKGPWYFKDQVAGQPAQVMTAEDVQAFPFQGYSAPQHLARIAGYYNAVHRLDAGVGMLLDALAASGKADQTLVLFIGDHGPPFARGKTTCYEAGLRVPFLIRWPGESKAQLSHQLVSSVDLLPTILDATGVELPSPLHGRSLRAAVRGEQAEGRDYLAAEFHSHGLSPFFPRRAIRDARYKLIHNLRPGGALQTSMDGDPGLAEPRQAQYIPPVFEEAYRRFGNPPEWELFDLAADPWELINLADEPSLTDVRQRLTQALSDWREETHDPLLDPASMQQLVENAAKKNESGK